LKVIYTHIVKHQSSREGGRPHLAVLHTTEGGDNPIGNPPSDLVGLGSLFDNEEASAHYGVNVDGKIARYVEDSRKAWSNCNFNPLTISLEQIGFAHFTRSEWFQRHDELKGAAQFLQYCHEKYNIPLRHGLVAGGIILRTGVVQHKNLGVEGCGHSDCGPGYPEKYVRLLARYYVASALNPQSKQSRKLKRKVNRVRKHYGVRVIP